MPLHGLSEYEGFYRMFHQVRGTRFKPEALAILAELADPSNKIGAAPREIGAAYTYFGQFIAHDISKIRRGALPPLRGPVPTIELVQDISPSLDLDCLYGSSIGFGSYIPKGGPHCGQFLGVPAPEDQTASVQNFYDLPRDPDCPESGSLIGDPRNDENFLVARIHVLMMNFHNRIFELWVNSGADDPFSKARQEVTLLYQYVIKNDFLNKIMENVVFDQLFNQLAITSTLLRPSSGEEPQIPIEFTVASFRFGHSMVRDRYIINDDLQGKKNDLSLNDIFGLTGPGGEWESVLNDPELNVDWGMLINLKAYGDNRIETIANAFDTALAQDLLNMRNEASNNRNLAKRNLGRGLEVNLPCAQDVIEHLWKCFPDYCSAMELPILEEVCRDLKSFSESVNIQDIANQNVQSDDPPSNLQGEIERLTNVTRSIEAALNKCDHWLKLPIWTYILIEPAWLPAAQANKRLGKLGSIIVGEVFQSLLKATRISIYNSTQTQDANFTFFEHLNDIIETEKLTNNALQRGEVTKDNIQLADIIKFTYNDLRTKN